MPYTKKQLRDRFWFIATEITLKKLIGRVHHKMKPEDYLFIKEVFESVDGSWYGLAEGKLEAWRTLRTVCRRFLKVCKEKSLRPFDGEQ
jgi:hypothetical protein